VKKLLPLSLSTQEKTDLQEKFPFDFKYDPSPAEILDTLIPEAYISSLYTSLLDAQAAEHGSRMSAMDSAVTNCKDAIRTLTLKMNKLRQAAITTELIEVVSGAESLNG
jgi:F-type H+-transporting ATPase subunit gamma